MGARLPSEIVYNETMKQITLQDLKDAIQHVKHYTKIDGRKLKEDEEKIYYPSLYEIANKLEISEMELKALEQQHEVVAYELLRFKEWCIQHFKDNTLKQNQTAMLGQFLKEDYKIGADGQDKVQINVINALDLPASKDGIEMYDKIEKEMLAHEKRNKK